MFHTTADDGAAPHPPCLLGSALVRVVGSEPESGPCIQEPTIPRRDNHVVVGQDRAGVAVHGVVAAQVEPVGEIRGQAHQIGVGLDHRDLGPQLVQAGNGAAVGVRGKSAEPTILGQRCRCLDLREPIRHDIVGVVPEPPARSRAGLLDQQGHDRRRIEEEDHRRCSGRRSLTEPATCTGTGTGTGAERFPAAEGRTLPSAIGRSNALGASTGTILATGRP